VPASSPPSPASPSTAYAWSSTRPRPAGLIDRRGEFQITGIARSRPRALLWQVLQKGGLVTAVGIGIGLLLALAAGQLLQGLLYGVDAVEPVVMVTAPLILLASSLLASYIPALRATTVDPTVASAPRTSACRGTGT
jgi:hypothetical protein